MMHNHSKQGGHNPLMLFAAGLAVGYVASWFLPEDLKTRQRKMMQNKAEDLKNILTDSDERERIIDIFKERTQEAKDSYQDARETFMKNLSSVRDSWQDIDKEKYMQILDKTMEEIRNNQSLPLRQLNKLKQYFESDYKLLQSQTKSLDDNDTEK